MRLNIISSFISDTFRIIYGNGPTTIPSHNSCAKGAKEIAQGTALCTSPCKKPALQGRNHGLQPEQVHRDKKEDAPIYYVIVFNTTALHITAPSGLR